MWYCTLIGNDGEVVANLPPMMYTLTVLATSVDNTLQNASDIIGPIILTSGTAQCEYNLWHQQFVYFNRKNNLVVRQVYLQVCIKNSCDCMTFYSIHELSMQELHNNVFVINEPACSCIVGHFPYEFLHYCLVTEHVM